jgi:hypothetical protein
MPHIASFFVVGAPELGDGAAESSSMDVVASWMRGIGPPRGAYRGGRAGEPSATAPLLRVERRR